MYVTATPTPKIPVDDGAWLIIPEITVEARVVRHKILEVQGEREGETKRKMETPQKHDEVASYDFSAESVRNPLVFAGHLDNNTHGPAVFWDLEKLVAGSEIYVWEKGVRQTYVVQTNEVVDSLSLDVTQVLQYVANFSLTLITCDGTFNQETHYDQRRIVSAVLVPQKEETSE
jgi:LPXTG-site transpeptidase (sortase) family protein